MRVRHEIARSVPHFQLTCCTKQFHRLLALSHGYDGDLNGHDDVGYLSRMLRFSEFSLPLMTMRDASRYFSHVPLNVNEVSITRCSATYRSLQRRLLHPEYRVLLSQRILRGRFAPSAEVYSLDRELCILSVIPIKHDEGFAKLLWRNVANCV